MTQDDNQLINLTRRQMLIGTGAVGLASAGAGLGTSALFSDRESFTGNSIVAGELDLLVDWQQHYEYFDGTEQQDIFVSAHPDHDGDGEQSIETEGGVLSYTDYADPDDASAIGANIPVLDCENIPPLSEADFGEDPITGDPMETLLQFSDVKPGDKGEITFSLHLCDNPGYIWMQADNVSEDGGVGTEPELLVDADNLGDLAENMLVDVWYDSDCDNRIDEAEPADVMLTLDFSGSMLYRRFGGVVSEDPIDVDGDGTADYSETTKIDLVEKGTRQFVQYLINQNADVQLGVAYFDGEQNDDGQPRVGLLEPLTTTLGDVDAALSGLRQKLANVVTGSSPSTPFTNDGNPSPSAGGGIAEGTFIGEGVDEAQTELANNARGSDVVANIVLSDGNSFNGQGSSAFSDPQVAADDARAASPAPATDLYTISVGEADDSTLSAMAGEAGGTGGNPQFFYNVDDPVQIPAVFGQLAGQFGAEKVFFSGTMADALTALSDGNGLALDGNPVTPFDEATGDPTSANREAFRGDGLMYCIGFAWELPADVGNEIQGDTLGFDLGFYTEQERSNDGSGPMTATSTSS